MQSSGSTKAEYIVASVKLYDFAQLLRLSVKIFCNLARAFASLYTFSF